MSAPQARDDLEQLAATVELGGPAGSTIDLRQCRDCAALVSFPEGAAKHQRWHRRLSDALPGMIDDERFQHLERIWAPTSAEQQP